MAEEIEDATIDVELSPSDLPKEIIEGDGIRTRRLNRRKGKNIKTRTRKKPWKGNGSLAGGCYKETCLDGRDLMSSSIIKISNLSKNHRQTLEFLIKTWLLSLDQIWIEII